MKFVRVLLFNFITKGYILRTARIVQFSKRGGSMVIDLFYVSSLFFLPLFIVAIPVIVIDITTHFSDHVSDEGINPLGLIFFSMIIFIMLNKDMFRAKSVGKRVCGYQIIDNKSGAIAHPAKCALRNITCFIWPLEGAMLLFNPQRRLGDYLAGTKVVEAEPEEAESILIDVENPDSYNDLKTTLLVSITLIVLLVVLSMLPILIAEGHQ